MCSQPSMSSPRTSLQRSRGRMELWFCIHSVWVLTHELCRNVCEKCVTKRSNVPLRSLGHLHVLRSGHRLRRLLCALSWENIWGWGTAWSFYLHSMEIWVHVVFTFCRHSFRTCSWAKMLPGQHLWLQEALLQSFLLHSLVSSRANQEVTEFSSSFVKPSFYGGDASP